MNTNLVLAFHGNGDYVTIPNSSELQNPDQITIEAWVNPAKYGRFISKGDGLDVNTAQTYMLESGGTNIGIALFLDQSTYASVSVNSIISRWIHVAATFNSSEGVLRFFTNGVLSASSTTNNKGTIILKGQKLRQTSLPLIFGWTPPFQETFSTGFLDEVRIWNIARSESEIRAAMSVRLTGIESNLVAYWNFDSGTASDVTGRGHNGILMGNASVVAMEIPGLPLSPPRPKFDVARSRLSLIQGFRFDLFSDLNRAVRIDASTNLVNWEPVVSFSSLSGSVEFIDPSATNFTRRFYRAVFP